MDCCQIKHIFSRNDGKLNNNYKRIYDSLSDDLQTYINSSFDRNDSLYDKLNSFLNDGYKRCVICNSEIYKWKSGKTCSSDCSKALRKETNVKLFGFDNAFGNPDIKSKRKSTMIEKYGVEHPIQSDIIKEKIKTTMVEKYGVEYSSQNIDVINKRIDTTRKKYGVDHVTQLDDFKNASKKSKELLYENKLIQNKVNTSKIKNIASYIHDITGLTVTEDQAIDLHLFRGREYSTEYIKSIVDYIHTGTRPNIDVIRSEYKSDSQFYLACKRFGYDIEPSRSTYEKFVCEFLDLNNIEYKTNDRSIIPPFELDIYIPSMNVAIEFNGMYWHSDNFVDKNYHQTKTKMCNDVDVTLIHIHEYLFSHKKDIYLNILKSKLMLNDRRVFARKCVIREVPIEEERSFLSNYHLQGYVSSKICYGLYYNDVLLTLCSFGSSRYNKKYKYELLRNCTLPNVTVVGGLRLIKNSKYGYKVEPSIWQKFEQGVLSVDNSGSPVNFKNPSMTQEEAKEENTPLNITQPLNIPSKYIQAHYKKDYTLRDALNGKQNNATMLEDIVTDPTNYIGVGLIKKTPILQRMKHTLIEDIDNLPELNNINDGGYGDVTIVNHKKGNYLKSAIGNNGMFDMTNPNIYKSLLPLGLYLQAQNNKNK